ncbi:MAG: hypothetical protein NT157_05245, partial [Candidatus Micrarchaeota archaeon]|nr:hypothetical protein [Candidatus Micrarchaeota archaeon]
EGGIVLFGGYSVGKSQELIKFLNEYCGIAPLVDPRVEKFSRVYESFGIKLDRIPLESGEAEELLHRDFAAIIPHHKVSRELASCLSAAYSKPVHTALATGWALKGWGDADMLFPISDHADFGDIVRYVEGSNAKNIFCCHGDEQILARELRKSGFNATPLGEIGGQTQAVLASV